MANKKSTKTPAKAKKAEKKTGLIARAKAYLASVRSEMKLVHWPEPKDVAKYTVAIFVSLIVVGVSIAVLDAVISAGLVAFAGLRG